MHKLMFTEDDILNGEEIPLWDRKDHWNKPEPEVGDEKFIFGRANKALLIQPNSKLLVNLPVDRPS